jgi:carbonic anhydrase
MTDPAPVPASDALARLKEGNWRFASNVPQVRPILDPARLSGLAAGQRPFAIVLADSRAPAEILFDQGLGDLFVIRVAGNIVAPSLIESVEFAADRLGVRLVVVLGHTGCGAIEATLEAATLPPQAGVRHLRSVVDRILPVVRPLFAGGVTVDPERLPDVVTAANVRASVSQLLHGSAVIDRLAAHSGLRIVGAVYRLETGRVEFLDEAQ